MKADHVRRSNCWWCVFEREIEKKKKHPNDTSLNAKVRVHRPLPGVERTPVITTWSPTYSPALPSLHTHFFRFRQRHACASLLNFLLRLFSAPSPLLTCLRRFTPGFGTNANTRVILANGKIQINANIKSCKPDGNASLSHLHLRARHLTSHTPARPLPFRPLNLSSRSCFFTLRAASDT